VVLFPVDVQGDTAAPRPVALRRGGASQPSQVRVPATRIHANSDIDCFTHYDSSRFWRLRRTAIPGDPAPSYRLTFDDCLLILHRANNGDTLGEWEDIRVAVSCHRDLVVSYLGTDDWAEMRSLPTYWKLWPAIREFAEACSMLWHHENWLCPLPLHMARAMQRTVQLGSLQQVEALYDRLP